MPRVALTLVANELGVGGTEKGLVTLAMALDRSRFDVRVATVRGGGVRQEQLEAAGIPVTIADGDQAALVEAMRGAQVVHVFRAGLAEPVVPAAARAAGVGVLVETNIFGQVDASADAAQFDAHLFISKMCAIRHRARSGLTGSQFHERHAVWYLPVDCVSLRDAAPDPTVARRRQGLDPDRPVVVRTGRDDDRKWRALLVDMVPTLLRMVPQAQVLYVGTTPGKRRRLERLGVLDRVKTPPMVEEEALPGLYAAADVFVNAAEIGEAQGLVLIEAMGMGVPIVTCSTPWVDNAQIEVIDDGITGYVADHPTAFAERVAALLRDDELRARMGRAAQHKAETLFDPATQARQVEALYISLLAGTGIPPGHEPLPAEVDAFPEEYQRRLHHRSRPLSRRERAEVRAARLRERGVWAARAVRGLDRERVRMLYWIVRARLRSG